MTRLSASVAPLAAGLLCTLGAACEEESLRSLAPAVAIQGCPEEGACSLEVGPVPAFGTELAEIMVENTGDAPLRVEGAILDSSSDPAFTVVAAPEEIEAGEAKPVQVRFNPVVEGEVGATLLVRTDAGNVPCDETTACDDTAEGTPFRDVAVSLAGTALEGAAPILDLDKTECDFGRVGLGAEARCTISVGNDGEADLVLTQVGLVGDPIIAPDGSAGASVFDVTAPVDEGIAPGTRSSVEIVFQPDAAGYYSAVLELMSNDPEASSVEVALVGEQVDVPTCTVRIESINGLPAGPDPEVEPLDDVVLTAEDSAAASSGAQIDSVTWSFVERPSGSTIDFADQGELTTGFTFADGVGGIDHAGHYRVAATVVDTYGIESTNLCEVAFDAVPTEQLLVQLGWSTPTGDMDLHIVRMDDSGGFCSVFADGSGQATACGGAVTNDCHFSNCTYGGLDWDGDGVTDTSGDPSLDIDDLCGYGPENVTLADPEPGQYLVAAHYWGPSCGGGGAVGNTLRVFMGGVLALEKYKELTVDEWWEAAIVHWPGPGGVPCVEPLDEPGACD